MSQRGIKILDPEKEERRKWKAKRDGQNPTQAIGAEVFWCSFCPNPIPPSQLMFDIGGQRACIECAKKDTGAR